MGYLDHKILCIWMFTSKLSWIKKKRTILIDEELKKYIFHIKLYPPYVVINKNELELYITPWKIYIILFLRDSNKYFVLFTMLINI